MGHWVGIDIGTSSCKAVAINDQGEVARSTTVAYGLSSPRPGWFEQDPEDWVRAALKCLESLADLQPVGIGLAGQMHGLVALDSAGNVLRPAMLWNDQRSTAQCLAMVERVEPATWVRLTGNVPVPGLQLPKYLWLREHEPEVAARTQHLLLPKDYVRFRLTGELATEPSDASGVGCLNLTESQWDMELLESLDVPVGLFPKIVGSSDLTGAWNGVPIVGGAGDQAGAAFGLGLVERGACGLSLGSSGVAIQVQDLGAERSLSSVNTFVSATGLALRLGVTLNCGTTLNRMVHQLGFDSAESLVRAAEQAENPGPVFLPYLDGERCPFGAESMLSGFVGDDNGHTLSELALSVLLGIACNLRLVARELEGRYHWVEPWLVTGGLAQSPMFVQMLADLLGRELAVAAADEGPAYGAGLLAGIGLGAGGSRKDVPGDPYQSASLWTPKSDWSDACAQFDKHLVACIESGQWNVFTRPVFLP